MGGCFFFFFNSKEVLIGSGHENNLNYRLKRHVSFCFVAKY